MIGLSRVLLAAAIAVGPRPAAPAAPAAAGEVTSVSVRPAAPGRAEIVIGIRGAVSVQDFLLHHPDRLVLDVSGARLDGSAALYDGVKRAGVRDLRYSQYRADVVRVVLELDQVRPYTLDRTDQAITVTFDAASDFAAWSSTDRPTLADGVDETPSALAAERHTVEAGMPAPALTGALSVPSAKRAAPPGEPRITVTWDNASIADVVAGFAAFSGRTIILGKDVKGTVTAEIKDQPWSQAFQAILATQGLSAQEMPGGIIRVDSPSALAALDSLEPLETSLVHVNYKNAGALAKTVESILTKGRGRVVADSTSNALVITDTRSHLGSVTDFVRSLDVRTPEVAIQSKIIFVDRTDLEQLGIKYDLGSSSQFFNKLIQRQDPNQPAGTTYPSTTNIVDLGGNSLSGIANADANISGSALDLIFSTAIGGFQLTSFLSALQRVDLSDVQAEPLISTMDNQKADILVGEETPVRIIDASSPAGAGTGAPRATVQFKETGIRLTVTPHVTNNRQVLMELYTERSAVQTLAAADLGYNFAKQYATNQLLINDGETAVIGGLTVTELTRSRAGIPLLSGLPFIGKLFSFSTDQERRRDLIILVTPHIVDDGTSSE